MANIGLIWLSQMASAPYYLDNQTAVLTAIHEQMPALSVCPPSEEHSLALTLEINAKGEPQSVTSSTIAIEPCLEKQLMGWRFPTHHEDLERIQLSIRIREGQYYLLPGAYVAPREIAVRYWMLPPHRLQADEAIMPPDSSPSMEAPMTEEERKP